MSKVSVVVENLSVTLGDKQILHDINFAGQTGLFVGLLGPNGAGKSTLLRSLAALNRPSAGTIKLGNTPLDQMNQLQLARLVAYVPQDTNVNFDFTAWEIALMGRHPHIGRFAVEGDEDQHIAARALEQVGVAHLARRSITSLSGGERQMVFIAKALAQQPHVLLLDEPISALDIRHQLHILSLVRDLTRQGLTAITVLHDLNLAARFCDRLYIMANGRMVAEGSPAAVLTPATLKASYGVHAAVRHDPLVNVPHVVALGDSQARQARPLHVHVLGGASSAVETLATLYRLGVHVSLGPVEAHDPDAALAHDLGMDVLTYPSFHTTPEGILSQARQAMKAAHASIAAPVPLGPANEALCTLLQPDTLAIRPTIPTQVRTLIDGIDEPPIPVDALPDKLSLISKGETIECA